MTSLTASQGQPSIAERILDCFPSGKYGLAGLLRLLEMIESTEVSTAAVECRAQPRLLINPQFVDRWADTPEKLLMLVMHELHHVLLGHTRLFPTATRVDNLVFDAVINAMLCRMFPRREHVAMFADYYSDDEFPACLLRPPTDWDEGEWSKLPPALKGHDRAAAAEVYRSLYSPRGATYKELYDILRQLISENTAAALPLLGDHRDGKKGSTAGQLHERSEVLFRAVRSIVEKWPQPPDPIAGRSLSDLIEDTMVRPRQLTKRAVLVSLFRRIGGTRTGRGPHRRRQQETIEVEMPFPTNDRRSVVLGALGARPLLHRGGLDVSRRLPSGERVHVYLDVSGSIGDLKGPLYGAVLACRSFVHPIVHLFSTHVADVTLKQLKRGECRTDWGTSIECVAGHLAANRIRRAVIITDGYVGRPEGGNRETLSAARLGVALTPGSATRDDLDGVADHWLQLPEITSTGESQ